MTATTFSRLPLLAGSAVAASLGRASLWTLGRYMRAPLASTGLLAMVTLTALAASNALYFQTTRHPAPFFAPSNGVGAAVADPAPVPMPLTTQRTSVLPAISGDTTGSVNALPQVAPAPLAAPAVVPDAPVGNRDAFAVQKRLTELGLFNGTVDGFYGPMTASAIRAFETRNGMTPTGALTPGVIDAILRSDSAGRVPVAQQQPVAVQPAPVVQQIVAAPQPQADIVIGRVAELSPVDQAVDTIGTAAASTIDSIVAVVDGRSAPPTPTPNAPVPSQPLPSTPPTIQVASFQPVAAPANNVQLVGTIQKGLASLGFYHGSIDGHPGDATAKAIREFENFHSYKVTGQVNPDLVGLLRQAGASV